MTVYNLKTIVNQVIGKKIVKFTGFAEGAEEAAIHFYDGTSLRFYHHHDCCEDVRVAQVDGDTKRMINSFILDIEEKVVDISETAEVYESGTATFYTITTFKGRIDMRWVGESNGYYSEDVNIEYMSKSFEDGLDD